MPHRNHFYGRLPTEEWTRMDGHQFDAWTKALTTHASRRRVVRYGAAALLGFLATGRRRSVSADGDEIGRTAFGDDDEGEAARCSARCGRLTPPGPLRRACRLACRRCDADFDRICLEVTGAVCCPLGQVCCQDCGTPFDRRCGIPDPRAPECCARTAGP
jgi:hypothetical protein